MPKYSFSIPLNCQPSSITLKRSECRNRPFPSSLVPLFQSESKYKTILMKMTLICMRIKLHAELIFIWKVSHLDSFWNRGTRELGNGLLRTWQIGMLWHGQKFSRARWLNFIVNKRTDTWIYNLYDAMRQRARADNLLSTNWHQFFMRLSSYWQWIWS